MLTGPLPLRLMFLAHLVSVDIRNTQLCGPDDTAFRTWAATIDFQGCGGPASPPPGGGAAEAAAERRRDVSFRVPGLSRGRRSRRSLVTVILAQRPDAP